KRTECVAGVRDMRFQELMPDVLHWLGITRIHRFASMSDMKCDALIRQGITIDERVPLPDDMIPPDARVEIEAKLAAGYFAGDRPAGDYAGTVGRGLNAVRRERSQIRRRRTSPSSTLPPRCASVAAWCTAGWPTAARPILRSTRAASRWLPPTSPMSRARLIPI